MINWLLGNSGLSYKHINNVFDLCDDPPKILGVKDLESKNTDKDFTLILSYEDVDLSILDSIPGIRHEEEILKDSKKIKVLLIRDPFNFFASRLKMLSDMVEQGVQNPIQKIGWNGILKLWKMYAREYLGETNFLGRKVTINYNSWFTDSIYRNEIAERCLKIANQDKGLQEVSEHGRGSSFDYLNFEGSAQKMEVTERWRYFLDNDLYLGLFRDAEILSLSDRIFGNTGGAKEISSRIGA